MNTLKEMVIALRGQGMSYKDIAKRLDVKETYARTVCSRAKATKATFPANACKNCGAELIHVVGAKRKQFCSDTCRYQWHNRLKLRKPYICYCEECGAEFISHGYPGKRFCSRECQTQARRKGKHHDAKCAVYRDLAERFLQANYIDKAGFDFFEAEIKRYEAMPIHGDDDEEVKLAPNVRVIMPTKIDLE